MKYKTIDIIPTGNELRSGTVLDTDSPMIMQQLLQMDPNCLIRRWPVVDDEEETILMQLQEAVSKEADIIIVIGGSGSGHLHSKILGKDYTHSVIDGFLDQGASAAIYGKNGHMWSRLICGKKDKCFIFNLPGPYSEAEATIQAFCKLYQEGASMEQINEGMAKVLVQQYGMDAAIETVEYQRIKK
uniref:molybdopterin-binding protein n=1 Tax=Ndongobacter massiliensis TaxID=1871025 RepID=UPI00092FE20F|nr:molybdopterin-binding protein [Ndongobacter massiliensis]